MIPNIDKDQRKLQISLKMTHAKIFNKTIAKQNTRTYQKDYIL
jgi:hypothetical protein